MGLFCLQTDPNWKKQLESVKGNIDLLLKYPDCDYLLSFISVGTKNAEKDWDKEIGNELAEKRRAAILKEEPDIKETDFVGFKKEK